MPPARIIGGPNLSMMGDPFTVALARNDEEWAFMWAAMSPDRNVNNPAPAVDLAREVVLFFGMSGSGSCPEQFEQVVISEESHVYAKWAEFDGERACTDDLRPYGVLVAVARELLPVQFRLSLREQLSCIGCAEHPDYIDVDLST
jgi:hypothetical protein